MTIEEGTARFHRICREANTRRCDQYSLADGTWTKHDAANYLPTRHQGEPATVAILDEVWFIAGASEHYLHKHTFLGGFF